MQKKTILMMADGDMPFNGFCALSSLLSLNCKNYYKLVVVCEKVNNLRGIIGRYSIDINEMEILLYSGKGIKRYETQKMMGEGKRVQHHSYEKRWAGKIKHILNKKDKDISDSILYLLWRTVGEMKRLKREEKIAKEIFSKYTPDLLLLCTDRGIGLVQSMIYLAKENGIPRVVAPMTALGFVDSLISMRYGRKDCEVGGSHINSKRLIERINPNWVAKYKGKKYIFYQPWTALSGWILKRISFNPWIVGGGDSTVVAVSEKGDFQKMQELCRDDFIQKKYILTQGIEDSMVRTSYMHRNSVRKRISEKYGLKGNNITVFALPQTYEHKMSPWEISKYNITSVIEKLIVQDGDILVSLHPKMKKEMYLYIGKMEKVHILEEALSSVIGIADVFVVLDDCSTKRWAELVGIDIITFRNEEFCQVLKGDIIEQRIRERKNVEILEGNENWSRKDFSQIIEDVLQ